MTARRSVPKSTSRLIASACFLCVLCGCDKSDRIFGNTASPRASIVISYAALLDPDAIVRTGQSLVSALREPGLRHAVQPFVDRYSELLPSALQMINGPDKIPYHSVVDYFPEGTRQPAWVALFRGGRFYACTDDKNHAKLFLLGDDPKRAYSENYSVVRHCLAMLAHNAGEELQLDVYAYQNDYGTSELKLNVDPYSFRAASFESKTKKLELANLSEFFARGPELRGAVLKAGQQLILYGAEAANQVLADKPVELADLAVAYRAAFHAGDNQAFISLDPNKDPTKATVNFGGFLENTRIGSVVLEADKRFKTITSGLDPNSFRDIRLYTRKFVPEFLTGAERDLLQGNLLSKGGWIGTRFWYYPDAVGVDSDLSYQYAVITNPRFTADAERSRDDFTSTEEFERRKQRTLSPSIRQNIDDLNRNYVQYAQAFPSLLQLETVARLMGLCSWLRKAHPQQIDLDELLTVELPPCQTELERTQLIAATIISYGNTERLDPKGLANKAVLFFLTPILDKTVKTFFGSEVNVAKFLSGKHQADATDLAEFNASATDLFHRFGDSKVRDLLQTKKSVELLAEYAADIAGVPHSDLAEGLKGEITAEEASLTKLDTMITQLKQQMSQQTSAATYNQLVDRHNQFVTQYEGIRTSLNQNIARYNELNLRSLYVTEIGGGIDLEPGKFAVRANPDSPKLAEFKNRVSNIKASWTEINDEKWISSDSGNNNEKRVFEDKPDSNELLQKTDRTRRWTNSNATDGSWRAALKSGTDYSREMFYDGPQQQLHVANFASGHLQSVVIARKQSSGRIIFEREPRANVLPPQDPPIWYSPN